MVFVAIAGTRALVLSTLEAAPPKRDYAAPSAAAELEKAQGPAPSAWRADAVRERIRFTSGVLPDTMRWTNRPTFQQVISFSGHRPR